MTDTSTHEDPTNAPAVAPVVAIEAAPEPAPEAAPTLADPIEAAAPDDAVAEEEAAETVDEAPEEEAPGFEALGLSEPILRAVAEKGYRTPTPIQAAAIPAVLSGRDVLGCAQTGTGKTASFTLPMLDILHGGRARARMPRCLILEPTRELALQVAENFVDYGKYLKLTHALVIGGESMSDQKDVLMRGVDVLIATPGRLMDMFERGSILLTDCKVLVIDEADRMLDMGFIPDVEKIVSLLPGNRQTLFFSATMAPEIRKLADAFLDSPKEITVSKPASVATTITEAMVLVATLDKREALRRLIRSEEVQNALIFCNRKSEVDILYKSLTKHRFSVGALHGDMTQSMRFATLEKFKAGELQLLCCSDVAARGIDIGGLSHVFNFDVPHHAEDYVHRIGRTGRAGREGRAFTLAGPDDKLAIEAVEKLIGHVIPRITIDGLDVVEWSEHDGRRRGRGRAAASGTSSRSSSSRSSSRAEGAAPAEGAGRGRGRGRGRSAAREETPAVETQQEELVAVEAMPAEAPREEAPRDEPRRAEGRREASRRDGGRRDDSRRDGGRRDENGQEEPRRDDYRRDAHRRDDHRRDEPRRDDYRRDRDDRRDRFRGRRDDDLGPSVLGFGDDVPAFMLIPARSARFTERHEELETN